MNKTKASINQTSILLSSAFPNNTSLYDILKVPDNATKDEIRDAYFQRALQCRTTSGDKHEIEVATLRLKAVHAAYEILFNPIYRSRYNRLGDIYDVVGGNGNGDAVSSEQNNEQKLEYILRDLNKNEDEFATIDGDAALTATEKLAVGKRMIVTENHRAPSPFDDSSSFFHLSSPSNVSGEDSDIDYISLADKKVRTENATTLADRGLFFCGGLPVDISNSDQVTLGDTVTAYKQAFDEAIQDIYDEAIGSLRDYESAVDQVMKAFAISDQEIDALLENIAEAKETSLSPFECGGGDGSIEVTLFGSGNGDIYEYEDDGAATSSGDNCNHFQVMTKQLSGDISDQHDDERGVWTKESSIARKQQTKATSSVSEPKVNEDSIGLSNMEPKFLTPPRPPKYPIHNYRRRNNSQEHENRQGCVTSNEDDDVVLDNSPPMARVERNRSRVHVHVVELPQEIEQGEVDYDSVSAPSEDSILFDKYVAPEPGKISLLQMRMKEASLSPGRGKRGK